MVREMEGRNKSSDIEEPHAQYRLGKRAQRNQPLMSASKATPAIVHLCAGSLVLRFAVKM